MKLKPLLSIGLLAVAAFIAPAQAAAPTQVTGEVLEVKDVAVYTYLRLKTATGETWAAVNKAPVAKGAKVTLTNVMTMENFESKELKKTFPTILFASLANSAGTGAAPATDPHAGMAKAPAAMADVKVAKASGANAYTVAEIIAKADKLKDKPVRVQGRWLSTTRASWVRTGFTCAMAQARRQAVATTYWSPPWPAPNLAMWSPCQAWCIPTRTLARVTATKSSLKTPPSNPSHS